MMWTWGVLDRPPDAGRHEDIETGAQKEASPVHAGFRRRHRQAQAVRDLGHRQPLDVTHDEYGPIVNGKLRDR